MSHFERLLDAYALALEDHRSCQHSAECSENHRRKAWQATVDARAALLAEYRRLANAEVFLGRGALDMRSSRCSFIRRWAARDG